MTTTHDLTFHSDEEIEAAYAAMVERQRAEMRKKPRDRGYVNARRYDYLVSGDGNVYVRFEDGGFLIITPERARVLAQHLTAAIDASETLDEEYFAAVRWVDAREVVE